MFRIVKIGRIGAAILFVSVAFLSALYGQEKSKAIMTDRFDPATESPEVFDVKAKVFIKMLKEFGKNTYGTVSLSENDVLAMRLDQLFGKDTELRKRVSLFKRGIRYRGEWTNIEFWIIPEGSKEPFEPVCVLCACPTISVAGESKVTPNKHSTVFTASVSSDMDVTYKWTVLGGIILDGQGTPEISVKPDIGVDVEAKLVIGGADPECHCMTEASFITKYYKQ